MATQIPGDRPKKLGDGTGPQDGAFDCRVAEVQTLTQALIRKITRINQEGGCHADPCRDCYGIGIGPGLLAPYIIPREEDLITPQDVRFMAKVIELADRDMKDARELLRMAQLGLESVKDGDDAWQSQVRPVVEAIDRWLRKGARS